LSRRSHEYPRTHHGCDKNNHDNQEWQKTFHLSSSERMSEKLQLGVAQSGSPLWSEGDSSPLWSAAACPACFENQRQWSRPTKALTSQRTLNTTRPCT
jgi:hypothetical protein